MAVFVRNLTVATALAAVLATTAGAQPTREAAPQLVSTPQTTYRQSLSGTDAGALRAALTAARGGDGARARELIDTIQDPLARKVALWALADGAPQVLSFFEADAARRDLNGWPRGGKRQTTAEKLLGATQMPSASLIAWFGEGEPQSAEGAMALAGALKASGRTGDAEALIRRWWREELFDADPQRQMRDRFGDYLTLEDDHLRTDMLLYGPQGPAAREMVSSLSDSYRPVAEARMALRANSARADDIIATMTSEQRRDPGLIFEQAAYFRRKGQEPLARGLAAGFKPAPTQEAATRAWPDRRSIVVSSLQNGDPRAAYHAASDTGLTVGPDAAEAEFYAGWIALRKLNDPRAAARHFAVLTTTGTSPITLGRAYYWQGRAAEATGDAAGARLFYEKGAAYITSFYGQLSAGRAGVTQIVLPRDPVVTQADRARFEGRELVRVIRMLADLGEKDLFKAFVLSLDDNLPTAAEYALLVDLVRGYGDQDTAMRVIRTAAQRGMVLSERGYPMVMAPQVPGGAETAFVFAITRQESNFDPRAKSSPGARGMMQLMPATAKLTASRLGEPYSIDRLFDADFNMRLGSRYLGDMVGTFGGSYVMAAAAYNAGPGRPAQWSTICGDPRGATSDPLDFIECIPFSETRNYVMRTLETTQVYRARMAGGTAPLTLASDLKRGGWTPYAPGAAMATETPTPATGTR